MTQQAAGTITQIDPKGQYVVRLAIQEQGKGRPTWLSYKGADRNEVRTGEYVTADWDKDDRGFDTITRLVRSQGEGGTQHISTAASSTVADLEAKLEAAKEAERKAAEQQAQPSGEQNPSEIGMQACFKSLVESGAVKQPADLAQWLEPVKHWLRGEHYAGAMRGQARIDTSKISPRENMYDGLGENPNMPGPADVPVEVYEGEPVPGWDG